MAGKSNMKRFTVSLPKKDYDVLRRLAKEHRPPLTLQYVLQYIVQGFLDENQGKQLQLDLGVESKAHRP